MTKALARIQVNRSNRCYRTRSECPTHWPRLDRSSRPAPACTLLPGGLHRYLRPGSALATDDVRVQRVRSPVAAVFQEQTRREGRPPQTMSIVCSKATTHWKNCRIKRTHTHMLGGRNLPHCGCCWSQQCEEHKDHAERCCTSFDCLAGMSC